MVDDTDHSHSDDEIRSQLEVGPWFRSQIGILVDTTSIYQFRSRFAQRVGDGVDPEVLFEVVVDTACPFFESPTGLGSYYQCSVFICYGKMIVSYSVVLTHHLNHLKGSGFV